MAAWTGVISMPVNSGDEFWLVLTPNTCFANPAVQLSQRQDCKPTRRGTTCRAPTCGKTLPWPNRFLDCAFGNLVTSRVGLAGHSWLPAGREFVFTLGQAAAGSQESVGPTGIRVAKGESFGRNGRPLVPGWTLNSGSAATVGGGQQGQEWPMGRTATFRCPGRCYRRAIASSVV